MPIRSRRVVLIALPVALVLSGVAAWVFWPHTAITRENAARITEGMTVQEVEAILGGPARDETPKQPRLVMIQSVRPDLEWNSDQVSVWVHLDADGRVTSCNAIPVPPQGPLDKIRQWLRF
jgi:outer membrane protein assembly factor BamE (lipoprotein component of BamABCDE complex)